MPPAKLLIDVCSGRWGWSKAFASRGWSCFGIDLIEPPDTPVGCRFIKANLLDIVFARGEVRLGDRVWRPDFLVASTPCEKFSVHGMAHFHKNPPYPESGIKLFEYVRSGFEATDLPYCIENVRAAQQFVGKAVHHCGPFYLWGNGVPPILPQGITKGVRLGGTGSGYGGKGYPILTKEEKKSMRKSDPMLWAHSGSPERKEATAKAATVPPELANCVADYAEAICGKAITA